MFPSKNRAQRSAYFAQNSMSWLTMKIAYAGCLQRPQNLPENLFELRIQSLCRFVKEQKSGFRSRIFASAARCCSPPERSYGWRSSSSVNLQRETTCASRSVLRSDFGKISNKSARTVDFTNSACGFCGSIPTLPVMVKLAAIRLLQACQQLERGGLARAVAAEQRQKFAFVQLQG